MGKSDSTKNWEHGPETFVKISSGCSNKPVTRNVLTTELNDQQTDVMITVHKAFFQENLKK